MLSKKFWHAVEFLMISEHPICNEEAAKQICVSPRYLEGLKRILAKKIPFSSKRGPTGYSKLQIPLEQITLADVFHCVESNPLPARAKWAPELEGARVVIGEVVHILTGITLRKFKDSVGGVPHVHY